MSEQEAAAFGRVAADGTVYVRTADGERPIGTWLAGTAEEGLAYYARRYADVAVEVSLLERRVAGGSGDAKAIRSSARRLRESLATAAVVGDLAALDHRLGEVIAGAEQRLAEAESAKAEAAARVVAAKTELVEEAERLAKSSDWKGAGDRLRAIGEEWRALRAPTHSAADRKADTELWARIGQAREEFARRRTAHFAALEQQRAVSAERKEKLIAEAEKLADSSEWAPTAARYRSLMSEWKAAGRAARGVEDDLWQRFRAAQDRFFTRRSEAFAARDAETTANVTTREALVAEAEALDPEADLAGVQRRLRDIQQRWERAGRVPKEVGTALERRLAAAEARVRSVADARRRAQSVPSNPLVIRLRESVGKLEARIERARAAGREQEAAEAEATLATQRQWLAQAESGTS